MTPPEKPLLPSDEDEELWEQAKKAAAERGVDLEEVLTQAVIAMRGRGPNSSIPFDPTIPWDEDEEDKKCT